MEKSFYEFFFFQKPFRKNFKFERKKFEKNLIKNKQNYLRDQ